MSLPIDSANIPRTGEAIVTFVQEPAGYVFRDEWFDISVSLQLSSSPRHYIDHGPTSTVKLCPEILRYNNAGKDTYQPVSQNEMVQIVMDPPTITLNTASSINKPDVCQVRCKILCPIDNRSEQCFALRFSETWDSEASDSVIKVKPVISRKMTMITAKLRVHASAWESTWYKDMGGRDKAMQVTVTLKDQTDNTVTNRRLPLHLTLMYENKHQSRVMNQDILRIIGTPISSIDPDTGEAHVQFRIEDVSKNHQKQDFVVQISADPSKDPDISPGFTKPVTVMSKKKRQNQNSKSSSSSVEMHQSDSNKRSRYNSPSVREAMRGMIEWTEEVINGLYPLKWSTMGYHQFPDGSLDYSRPYYNMTNPNDTVNSLLSSYEKKTRENMRVLISAVDSSQPGDSYGGGLRLPNARPQAQAQAQAQAQQGQTNNYHPYNQSKMGSQMGSQIGNQLPTPMVSNPISTNPMGNQMNNQFNNQFNNQMSNQMNNQMGSPIIPPYQTNIPGSTFNQQQQQHQQQQQQQQQQPNQWNMQQQFCQNNSMFGMTERNDPEVPDYAIDQENRQGEVRFVLARQFKLVTSDKQLGYPAFSFTKELLGFYRKSSRLGGGGRFIPIHKHRQELGPGTLGQATGILEESIMKGDNAVFDIMQYQSLTDMVQQALNFESWLKNPPDRIESPSSEQVMVGFNSPDSF